MKTYIIYGRTISGTDARIYDGILAASGVSNETAAAADFIHALAVLDGLPPIVTDEEIGTHLAKCMK